MGAAISGAHQSHGRHTLAAVLRRAHLAALQGIPWNARPHDTLPVGSLHDLVGPLRIRVPRPLVISPAAFFELHALRRAEEDLEGLIRRGPGFVPGSRRLRLWPFRWPAQAPGIVLPEAAQKLPAPQQPGLYLDILF